MTGVVTQDGTGSQLGRPRAFAVPPGAAGSGPTRLFSHFASVGNVGTGATDLYSDTIAANTFSTPGDTVKVMYAGLPAGPGRRLYP